MDKVHTRSVVDILTSRDKGLNIEYDTHYWDGRNSFDDYLTVITVFIRL